ncbi:hypothetical protein ET475_08345 [Microbacterium protaetiae]|uniref:Uncharacterized protein n=1 Tax=Microbacterium protaetiae TaxID=2509458 RepID=A0A4P6ECN9_9MICO|nr:hypothetical protein [Microbacterium protaetiae]QAY60000.1 hypothetical protein ET475_08345 [Microbacterium protaetiae]
MKNQGDESIEIDGVIYEVAFSSELDDAQRADLGLPARGTMCACSRCACENEADAGRIEHPICGCCLADCPDVHPPADLNAE